MLQYRVQFFLSVALLHCGFNQPAQRTRALERHRILHAVNTKVASPQQTIASEIEKLQKDHKQLQESLAHNKKLLIDGPGELNEIREQIQALHNYWVWSQTEERQVADLKSREKYILVRIASAERMIPKYEEAIGACEEELDRLKLQSTQLIAQFSPLSRRLTNLNAGIYAAAPGISPAISSTITMNGAMGGVVRSGLIFATEIIIELLAVTEAELGADPSLAQKVADVIRLVPTMFNFADTAAIATTNTTAVAVATTGITTVAATSSAASTASTASTTTGTVATSVGTGAIFGTTATVLTVFADPLIALLDSHHATPTRDPLNLMERQWRTAMKESNEATKQAQYVAKHLKKYSAQEIANAINNAQKANNKAHEICLKMIDLRYTERGLVPPVREAITSLSKPTIEEMNNAAARNLTNSLKHKEERCLKRAQQLTNRATRCVNSSAAENLHSEAKKYQRMAAIYATPEAATMSASDIVSAASVKKETTATQNIAQKGTQEGTAAEPKVEPQVTPSFDSKAATGGIQPPKIPKKDDDKNSNKTDSKKQKPQVLENFIKRSELERAANKNNDEIRKMQGSIEDAFKDLRDMSKETGLDVKNTSNGNQMIEFPDGTKMVARPTSRSGEPTMEIQWLDESKTKIRYIVQPPETVNIPAATSTAITKDIINLEIQAQTISTIGPINLPAPQVEATLTSLSADAATIVQNQVAPSVLEIAPTIIPAAIQETIILQQTQEIAASSPTKPKEIGSDTQSEAAAGEEARIQIEQMIAADALHQKQSVFTAIIHNKPLAVKNTKPEAAVSAQISAKEAEVEARSQIEQMISDDALHQIPPLTTAPNTVNSNTSSIPSGAKPQIQNIRLSEADIAQKRIEFARGLKNARDLEDNAKPFSTLRGVARNVGDVLADSAEATITSDSIAEQTGSVLYSGERNPLKVGQAVATGLAKGTVLHAAEKKMIAGGKKLLDKIGSEKLSQALNLSPVAQVAFKSVSLKTAQAVAEGKRDISEISDIVGGAVVNEAAVHTTSTGLNFLAQAVAAKIGVAAIPFPANIAVGVAAHWGGRSIIDKIKDTYQKWNVKKLAERAARNDGPTGDDYD